MAGYLADWLLVWWIVGWFVRSFVRFSFVVGPSVSKQFSQSVDKKNFCVAKHVSLNTSLYQAMIAFQFRKSK